MSSQQNNLIRLVEFPPCIIYNGDSFCDLLFAFLCKNPFSEKEFYSYNRAVELAFPTCPTCPISRRTSEILIYMSWDKDFIALAKTTIQIMRFVYVFFFFRKHAVDIIRSVLPMRFYGFPPHVSSRNKKKKSIFRQVNIGWTSGF